MRMGCSHPTIHKFIQLLRKEQRLSENKLARIIAGKSAAKMAQYEKNQARLIDLLKHYSNNNSLKKLEGLSFNNCFFAL